MRTKVYSVHNSIWIVFIFVIYIVPGMCECDESVGYLIATFIVYIKCMAEQTKLNEENETHKTWDARIKILVKLVIYYEPSINRNIMKISASQYLPNVLLNSTKRICFGCLFILFNVNNRQNESNVWTAKIEWRLFSASIS